MTAIRTPRSECTQNAMGALFRLEEQTYTALRDHSASAQFQIVGAKIVPHVPEKDREGVIHKTIEQAFVHRNWDKHIAGLMHRRIIASKYVSKAARFCKQIETRA